MSVLRSAWLCILLLALPGLDGAASAAGEAVDPMQPASSSEAARTLPLRFVTVTTGDLQAARRFYQGAMGMEFQRVDLDGAAVAALAGHWGLPASAALQVAIFSRPEAAGAAARRVIELPGDRDTLRPGYDTRPVGPLGFGFPVRGLDRRYAIARAMGFEATAEVVTMAFPRADGSTYDVGEFHLMAPDDVLVLGVDRGPLTPVGPLDEALDIGGVAYASVLVGDLAAMEGFLADALGLERRRAITFRSGGPDGGLRGLRAGEEVAFQQWFSPGATTGYLVVMELLDGPKTRVSPLGPARRGVAMWSFEVRSLPQFLEHWQRWSGSADLPPVRRLALPGVGDVDAVLVETPDGLPVEVFQR
jgi:catechol 2,3-dioxygenase-like lactoylglutathione lyase family enzyme